MRFNVRKAVVVALCSVSVTALAADGEPPALLKLEDIARAPAVGAAALSPDGRRVVLIETIDGRGSIVVKDASGANRVVVFRNPERSIGSAFFSRDGRYILFLQDAGGDEGYHLFRADPSKPGTAVDLTPFPGTVTELVGQPSGMPDQIVVTNNKRDRVWPDLYAVTISTGATRELVRNDGTLVDFVTDATASTISATAIRKNGNLDIMARERGKTAWRRVYTAPPEERLRILTMSSDGRRAIFKTNGKRPTDELTTVDLASGKVAQLVKHRCGSYDAGNPYFAESGALLATSCVTDRPQVFPDSPGFAKALEAARRILPAGASLNVESWSRDGTSVLFYSDASDSPGQLILADGKGARIFADTRPWLRGRTFAKSEYVRVPARDGLPIPLYLTRVPGQTGPQPMVVALHGGPWSRDEGGFEGETQLFANRGYSTLQVNFRGSTGFGTRHVDGGVKQFGRAMSDDVVDAVKWAVDQKIADPARICVMGGSYGGYATAVAMTRDAGLFKCGIDFAGPVDLATLIEAFPPSWRPFSPRSWFRFVGDPSIPEQRADMNSRSPVHQADRLRDPMLIFQGANDPRVTQEQSDAMVKALKRKNIPYTYLLAKNEGHSFANEETGLAVNRAVEKFLAQHLGGRVQPSVDTRVQQALDKLTSAGEEAVASDGKKK